MIKVCVIRLWAPAILLGGMVLAASPGQLEAQAAQSASQTVQAATRALLDKARALELRGRRDLAEQTWQEVLLADPRNTEALGDLARAAKLDGDLTLSNKYLSRIRAIDPDDANIARVENLTGRPSQKVQTVPSQKVQPAQAQKAPPAPGQKPQAPQSQKVQLQQAAELAGAGKYAAAMAIYRRLFGTHPPAGDLAVTYYETEAATEDGRLHAVAGLRALLESDPGNTQYRVALGDALTYDPSTREEGREYLQSFPNDPKAVAALRQSLLWDAANPAMEPFIRAYLATHNDPELAAALQPGAKPNVALAAQPAPPSTPAPVKTANATIAQPPPSAPVVAAAKAPPAIEQGSGRRLPAFQRRDGERDYSPTTAPVVTAAKAPPPIEQAPNRAPPPKHWSGWRGAHPDSGDGGVPGPECESYRHGGDAFQGDPGK